MLAYQEKYIENAREIAALSDFYAVPPSEFSEWLASQKRARERIETLRRENIALLDENLFPALDSLYEASPEDIRALEDFAAALMDWKTNLDNGVYVLIHDSLLSLYRVRKDRAGIIRELYKLGMGLYYENRSVQGIDRDRTRFLFFRNEMVFTEGGSYLKFFPEIDDEETKGYIVRSLANIAICSDSLKRRIAISSRVLNIVKDDYYRALAPGLPWDTFLSRTNQQMSSNRAVLSKGDLTAEELAAVLEACHEVFGSEAERDNPNVRWLWPYYEMEYTCGFADLATTMGRLEELMSSVPYDSYDVSGFYANIQLPIYYGRLMMMNPSLLEKPRHVKILAEAYEKMMKTLLSVPTREFTDHLFYNVRLVITDYFETEGVPSYRDITFLLMQRYAGELFIRSRKAADMTRELCAAIYASEPDFFDDIEFIREASGEEKRKTLLDYAEGCGLYHDFGLIKMNMERISLTRNLFEEEYTRWKLHTASGYDDLRARKSTEAFAEVAFGHHGWYNGSAESFPEDYVRNSSQYRQMTDAVAVISFVFDSYRGDFEATVKEIIKQGGKRFSPLVTSYFEDEELVKRLREIFTGEGERYYREVYEKIS